MEPLVWVFIIVVGIGAIVAGIFDVAVLIVGWWWIIPLNRRFGRWLDRLFILSRIGRDYWGNRHCV